MEVRFHGQAFSVDSDDESVPSPEHKHARIGDFDTDGYALALRQAIHDSEVAAGLATSSRRPDTSRGLDAPEASS
jgi:hypothetical protein